MQKILVAIALIFFAFGCKQHSDSEQKQVSEPAVIDSTAVTVESDPDPTDTIPAGGYEAHTSDEAKAEMLRKVLPVILEKELVGADSTARRFVYFETDLNGDGKAELLVGFTGMNWCGSGGCTALLLSPEGTLVTRFTVAGFPFTILDEKTNGWKNLVVYSGGADRLLKFDGKTYPKNPSIAPKFSGKLPDESPRALAFATKPYPWFTF